MNTEQFKREKLAGEYLNQYSIDGGSDYAASIFNAFCVGYTIAETPLLARIAELERQLANREPFVVAMPCIIEIKDTKYPYDVPSIYYLATEVITAIEAAGGMVKI